MALLDEILAWSNGLPMWQRDALRRLFQLGKLDAKELNELYVLVKAGRGLPNAGGLLPQPLAQTHLPSTGSSTVPVVLTGMRDLQNVNIIGPAEHLKFATIGMTVVYGGNGAGKSGYGRVLKRACRARDTKETVLPDARDAKAAAKVPEATFEVTVGGTTTQLHWKQNEAAPDELATVAVFDGKCARAYLDAEQDVAYLPYGLDIVEGLGRIVIPAVADKLKAEIAGISVDTTPFADLVGPTKVGQLIGALSHKTDPKAVTSLATLSGPEQAHLKELDKMLAEADPTAKAQAQRLAAGRISSLRGRVDAAISLVSVARVQTEKAIDDDAEVALATNKAVAEQFRGGEPLLPGTGDRLWKTLMEAAEAYSTKEAYPGATYPRTEADARCVLCQQPLTGPASERMKRFDAFLKDKTSQDAKDSTAKRAAAQQVLERASASFQFDANLTAELNQHDPALGPQVTALEASTEARRKAMAACHKSHAWAAVPAITADVRPALDKVSQSLTQQAADLDKAANPTQKKLLEEERNDLRLRDQLGKRLKPVLDLVDRMKLRQQLEGCAPDVSTKGISDKAKEFTNSAVTGALRKSLDAEFQKLGVGHIKTKLADWVEKGKTKYKLVLDLPGGHTIEAVLSEGEQRAIAIASFFAELGQAGHKGGIVFDDPVSSLDHEHRRQVAARLVDEATFRQVVVFTHDATFLGELRDALEQALGKVPCLFCHLEWRNDMAGGVVEGLPWDHQNYKERLDQLRNRQAELAKTWPAHPTDANISAIRDTYSSLRATVERVVQDLFLAGVVRRYSDYVQLKNLEKVVVLQVADCHGIQALYTKCNKVTDAHDPTAAKQASVPSPTELAKDIADLTLLIEAIRARRKAAAP